MAMGVADGLPETELTEILSAFKPADANPVAAFARLFDMIRPRRGETVEAAAARYDAVLAWLEADPSRAAQVRHHMLTLLGSRRLVSFFADSGILPATGFFTGSADGGVTKGYRPGNPAELIRK